MSGPIEERAPTNNSPASSTHKSVEFLRDYNAWRRDLPRTSTFPVQPDPIQAWEAIEWACGQLEVGAVRYTDALARIENQATEWEALEAVCKEQHQAIAAVADALHQAQRAIAAYAEVKDAEHERRARRGKKSP